MFNYILLVLYLIIVPTILGLPWTQIYNIQGTMAKFLYSYIMGFFVMLALFETVFFPAAIMNITFQQAATMYSMILFCSLGYIIWNVSHSKLYKWRESLRWPKFSKPELFFAGLFLILLWLQIYYALFYSRTYMADDGYVTFSTSALANNYLYLTNMYTGLYQTHNYAWLYRVIQTFNYLPAYLSWFSHVHPTIIAHTILYAEILLLAYGTYFIMAHKLFKDKENQLIFLCFVATLFVYGYHSHYSLTFRLLGPNNEGKAVLAVVQTPFMMVLMQDIIKYGYNTKYGIQLLILSIAACSLTMGGIYTMAALLFATIFFTIIQKRSYQPFIYLLWGGSIPSIFACLYLFFRFAPI